MTMSINKLRRIVNDLQELLDEAENREVKEINTSCNTYGMYNFVCCGSDGYLDLDKDVDELLVDDNDD